MLTTVNDTASLLAAIDAASPGDIIELEDGVYDNVQISKRFIGEVLVRSKNPKGAVCPDLNVYGCSHIAFEDILFQASGASTNTAPLIRLDDDNDHIRFEFNDIEGVDQTWTGIWADSPNAEKGLIIRNNNFRNLFRGMALYKVQDVTIVDNFGEYLGEDFIKISSVDGALIEYNRAENFLRKGSAHCDFMQFEGTGTKRNITARRNILLIGDHPEAFAGVQGIFGNTSSWENGLVEENIVYTCNVNGIKIANGTGCIVRKNTLVHPPVDLYSTQHQYTRISSPGVEEDNIETTDQPGSVSPATIKMNTDDPSDPYYQSKLITNSLAGRGATIADLMPIMGTEAEGKGAWAFMQELVGGAVPDPQPDPEPDPTPTPDPEPEPDPSPEPGPVWQPDREPDRIVAEWDMGDGTIFQQTYNR